MNVSPDSGRVAARERLVRLWARALRDQSLATASARREADAYVLGVADAFREAFGAFEVLDAAQEARVLSAAFVERVGAADEDDAVVEDDPYPLDESRESTVW